MAFAFAFNLLLERMRNRTPSLMDMSYEEESIPTFNRADSHPVAPPRRPIFANSDFAELVPLAVSAAPVESSAGLRPPTTPEPLAVVDHGWTAEHGRAAWRENGGKKEWIA